MHTKAALETETNDIAAQSVCTTLGRPRARGIRLPRGSGSGLLGSTSR